MTPINGDRNAAWWRRRSVDGRGQEADHQLHAGWAAGARFHTSLADLAAMTRTAITTAINPLYPLTGVTRPMPAQHKVFDLLGVAV